MKRLRRWLARERKAALERPTLAEALLGRRPIRYVIHRLRFVTVRVFLRTALHLLEVLALSSFFPIEYLAPVLFLRNGALLLGSLWWGALEAQRDALREAHAARDPGRAAGVVARFQALALLVIGLEQVGFLGWMVCAPRPFAGFSIYDAYAMACALRVGLETWTRTQHSAVFAIARVQRPLASLALVDVFEVLGLLLLWLRLGPLAFAVMLAAVGVLRATLTLYFVRRMRARLDVFRMRRSLLRALNPRELRRLPWRAMAKDAAANGALQLDVLSVLLLTSGLGGRQGLALSMLFHALGPFFAVGFGWSRVFYFDFKQIERRAGPLLARRFGVLLDRVGVLYPLLLGALVLPLVELLAGNLWAVSPWVLAAYVVARSLFALRQVEGYGYRDYRLLAAKSGLLVLVLAATAFLASKPALLMLAVTAALAVSALAGRRAEPRAPAPEPGRWVSPEQWLCWLARCPGSMRIVALERGAHTASLGRLRRALAEAGFDSYWLRLGQKTMVGAVPGEESHREFIKRLVRASAGSAFRVFVSPASANGRALLSAGCEAPAWLRLMEASHRGDPGERAEATAARLVEEFSRLHPAGRWLSATQGNVRGLSGQALHELRLALAATHARGTSGRHLGKHLEVSVLQPSALPSHLFLMPRTRDNGQQRRLFSSMVHEASVTATLRQCLGATPLHDR